MNRTLSIGLAGYPFIIDENAYKTLNEYLSALKNTLAPVEAEEVMQDIEIRMVEIFKESLGKREIIHQEDVEKAISLIGKPEEISQEEELSQTSQEEYTENRQLFLDTASKKIGGVCAGLAHYFNMDIKIMRIIWLSAFILGLFTTHISSILIGVLYIILLIILPKAKTASDFLKMKGKPTNFDNIKEQSNKNQSQPSGEGIWNFIRYTLGIIAIFLMIFSLFGIIILLTMNINSPFGNLFLNITELDFYFGEVNTWIMKILVIIGTLIPTLLFGIIALKLFSPKTKIKNLGFVLGGLLLSFLALGSYMGISLANISIKYDGEKEETENISINTQKDTLYVDLKKINIPKNYKSYSPLLFSDRKTVFEKELLKVEITKNTETKSPYLIIKKEGNGYNIPLKISVPVEVINNKILLPNFIKYPYEHRFRNYGISYKLILPTTTQVFSLSNDISFEKENDKKELEQYYDNDWEDNNHFQSIQNININGKNMTIEKNSKYGDSIKINGKLYEKEIAEDMIEMFSK